MELQLCVCSVIRTVCMLWYAGAVYSVRTYVQHFAGCKFCECSLARGFSLVCLQKPLRS